MQDDDALSTFEIFIEPTHLKALQSNVWNEEPLPSKLVVDNIAYEIGITYRGDHIRKFRKKSYRIDFGAYNRDFEGREIHLNAEYRDPSLIRNKLSFDFFQTIGSTAPDGKHVFIELNGKPMGVYLQLESAIIRNLPLYPDMSKKSGTMTITAIWKGSYIK